MTGYTPPLRDMRFALESMCERETISGLPGADGMTPELIDQVLSEAGKLASEVWAPLNAVGDRAGARLENGVVRTPDGFPAAYRAFAAAGWNGVASETAHGGMGLPLCLTMAVQEMWHTANMALALCPLLNQAAVAVLTRHGTDDQKRRYLDRLVAGDWTGAMCMTEPQAGSDLGEIRTRAVPEGDHYRITGQKTFITYGEHDLADNIVHMVLARTPDAPSGSAGLSLFAVPKLLVDPDGALGPRNDLGCVSLEHKLGLHACPTAVMSYGDGGGAWGEMVGAECRGLPLMFTMMNDARLGVGLQGVAVCERAYQRAAAYARARVQSRPFDGGAPVTIDHHPDVRRMLMSLRTHAEATRALVYHAASTGDVAARHPQDDARNRAQQRVDLLTPIAKAWCTDVGVEMASLGIQVHGGVGYIEETGAAQILRDARVTPIYEGTNGIQAHDLMARKLLRDGGVAMRELIRDMGPAASDQANEPLRNGIAALRRVSDWAVQTGPSAQVFAGAVPFLRLTGTVVAGWLMARAAASARAQLVSGAGDPTWFRAKIATARFYSEHILSQAPALATPITSGAASVLELEPDRL